MEDVKGKEDVKGRDPAMPPLGKSAAQEMREDAAHLGSSLDIAELHSKKTVKITKAGLQRPGLKGYTEPLESVLTSCLAKPSVSTTISAPIAKYPTNTLQGGHEDVGNLNLKNISTSIPRTTRSEKRDL